MSTANVKEASAASVKETSPAGRKDPVPATGLRGLLRRLTFEQWAAIDAEFLEPRSVPGIEWRAMTTMLLVAFTLTLQRYFGNRKFFTTWFSDAAQTLPYRGIWEHIYWSFGCAVTYVVIPALFIHFVLRERIGSFGLQLRGFWRHAPLYLAMFAAVFPLVILASTSSSFLQRYPFYASAGRSWTELLLWESAYGAQFVALEFFFRGFILFVLARYVGAYAIFIMVIPYTMIHFAKPLPETMGAIIAGTALGTLALRTRSIAGGVCIHIAVAWSMDLMALWQEGQLQRLLR